MVMQLEEWLYGYSTGRVHYVHEVIVIHNITLVSPHPSPDGTRELRRIMVDVRQLLSHLGHLY